MSDEDIVSDDAIDGTEQTVETKEQPDVKTLIAQKTHWREKAKKLEEEKQELLKNQKPEPAPVATAPTTDDDWKRRIEFTVTHKEYDSEDIAQLMTLSKGLGVDLEKAKDNPLFTAYYAAKQETVAKQGTTPQGRSPKVQPSKPIGEMTREEHEAHFRKLIQ